jgi:adenylate kinase family enzyme
MICDSCGHNAPLGDGHSNGDRARCVVASWCSDRTIREAVVLERLKVYRANTKPLVDFYCGRPTFRSINGAQAPDRVAADLVAAIEAAGNGSLGGTR